MIFLNQRNRSQTIYVRVWNTVFKWTDRMAELVGSGGAKPRFSYFLFPVGDGRLDFSVCCEVLVFILRWDKTQVTANQSVFVRYSCPRTPNLFAT